MYDYGGLDLDSFQVIASFPINGILPGENLAERFRMTAQGVWELKLDRPAAMARGTLMVSVKDRQGNRTRIERTFSMIAPETH